jgi:hypothetical protein
MPPRKLTQAQIDGLARGRATRAANLAERKRKIASGEKIEPTQRRTKNTKRIDLLSDSDESDTPNEKSDSIASLKKENKQLKYIVKTYEEGVKQHMIHSSQDSKPENKKLTNTTKVFSDNFNNAIKVSEDKFNKLANRLSQASEGVIEVVPEPDPKVTEVTDLTNFKFI